MALKHQVTATDAGKRILAPYGTWKSPITADILSSHSIKFSDLASSPSGAVFVVETRSGDVDDGRYVIVEWPSHPGAVPRDVLPSPHSAKTKTHGYGGGAIAVDPASGHVIFSNQGSGVWHLDPVSCKVRAIVDPHDEIYYADFDVRICGKWILAVKEDHRGAEDAAGVKNSIVAINKATGQESHLTGGGDFFTHPRFSPDGSKISFLRWCHPDMPWTGTELFVYAWDEQKAGLRGHSLFRDGSPGQVSIAQPRWGLNDVLFYVSDKTGTWQFEQVDFNKRLVFSQSHASRSLMCPGFEHGDFAEPEWKIGSSTYVQLNAHTLVATWTRNAREQLVVIDLDTFHCTMVNWQLTDIRANALKRISDNEFVVIGGTATSPPSLYRLKVPSNHLEFTSLPPPLRSSLAIPIETSYYSIAQHIDVPRSGNPAASQRSRTRRELRAHDLFHAKCHAYFLPPTNPNYIAPSDTLPPLIVLTHEGPTLHSGPGLVLKVQYFTSRGFAVALTNPLGSSGYGRSYREALNSQWGVADAADVASCAEYITNELKWADPDRIGTVGGSAGGYVTLQALYCHPNLWRAGVSLYGISDVKRLVAGTHKFESWYARRLLFGAKSPEPSDETKELIYRERSACYHVDKLTAPLLLLQGDADEIVPLDQAKEMERAMKEGGKKVKLVVFEDEGHGFVKADTERRALREEHMWWIMNLVRNGRDDMEVEDKWVWVDDSSSDEKAKPSA